MPTITIRNVPVQVRDSLASKASQQGKSMQEYVLGELSYLAGKRSQWEVLAEIRNRAQHYPPITDAEILADLEADKR